MGFTSSSVANLKDQIDIVDVVSSVVPLKRAGSNYKGVCPFHNEKTPSFVVSEQKQIFTCFGCGASGDAIEFVIKYYGLDFSEAVEKLADENGITLERTNNYSENLDIYYEINREAATFFYSAFTTKANKGYAYMKTRGISPSILKKFGIGYADESWDSLYQYLISKGYEKKYLLELGLISEGKAGKCYDKFRNRVMFPIINTAGKVIGFGGRAIDPNDSPKYLNSSESKVFRKKNNLYGLNLSRAEVSKRGFIILVEGYMDTIALYQGGIQNVAASLGTALTESQAKLIKRYTENVVLCYDSDQAGRNAAIRGIEVLNSSGCKVKVMHVTDGKDPDEFIKKEGKSAFLKLIETALPFADYKIESIKVKFNLSKREEKIDCLKQIAKVLRKLGPVERDIYIKKVSNDLGISEVAFKSEVDQRIETRAHERPNKEVRRSSPVEGMIAVERELLKLVFRNESYLEKINSNHELLITEISKHIFEAANKDVSEHGALDRNRFLDFLDDDERSEACSVIDNISSVGDEASIFSECIAKLRLEKLKTEERKIREMLDMADDASISQEEEIELLKKLKDIQLKIEDERTKG